MRRVEAEFHRFSQVGWKPQQTRIRLPTVSSVLLTAAKAARLLGIRPSTLYAWLAQSDHGLLRIRGVNFTIDYLQGGPHGQGKILIEAAEIDRLKQAMRVVPKNPPPRRLPVVKPFYPGIHVPLGRPNNF